MQRLRIALLVALLAAGCASNPVKPDSGPVAYMPCPNKGCDGLATVEAEDDSMLQCWESDLPVEDWDND